MKRTDSKIKARRQGVGREPVLRGSLAPAKTKYVREQQQLRRRLAAAEAELTFYKTKHEWLQSALAAQRHARQLLEASVAATYSTTVARIREVVASLVPRNATLVVVSKGDPELVRFEERRAWHFPRSATGGYAGYYPADSCAAISELKDLIAKGGKYLLLPNTAFWWLEHYRQWGQWLEGSHRLLWRDERCAIYQLCAEQPILVPAPAVKRAKPGGSTVRPAAPSHQAAGEKQLGPAAPRVGSDILCFPIIDWGFRYQRPQQLMRRFALAGHRVFYLSHLFRKTGKACSLRNVAPGVWEVALRGPRYHAYQGVLDEGHREALLASLLEVYRVHRLNRVLTVIQSPFWWPLVKEAAQTLGGPVVYDCMDYHAGFSGSNPLLVEQERELLSRADLVVAASAVLKTHAAERARKVLLLRNACDYEHFARAAVRPKGPRPVIGYYGAIADWFDSDLVADLAERRPDWNFILVGSTFSADVRRLSRLKNVLLPGEKPYQEIPNWLARFDAAVLPFKRTPLTEAANPVKAYEILASGKPLVSVPLPEVVRLKPLVRLASTAEEFEIEIQAELNRKDASAERERRAFARHNTWEQRFQQLSLSLDGLLTRPDGHSAAHRPELIPARFL